MKKITLLIVDDHKLIRDIYAMFFAQIEKFSVVGQTGDGEEAISIARSLCPDIVLLDINMMPMGGFEVLKMIRKFSPSSRIIAVSIHLQPGYVRRMLKEGAVGYVSKGASVQELLRAIDEVLMGNIYISEDIKEILTKQWTIESPGSGIDTLSNREMEIIKLVRNGLSSKMIAETLHIEPKTVEVHRHNILKKLKLHNTASLIELVNAHGL